MGIIGQSDKSI